MAALTDEDVAKKRALWLIKRREKQAPPSGNDAWDVWIVCSGRGYGKTKTAAEWLWWKAYRNPRTRWAIVVPTFADGRDTCVEGDSGILNCAPDGFVRTWNRSMGEIIFANESRAKIFSAEEPERLRGPQHHGAWCDEFAAMANQREVWDQLNFGLRLGKNPQIVITTTPKPTKLMKELMSDDSGRVRLTVGTTFENAANLAPSTIETLKKRYEGTRLGRQELYGELLGDVEGALWNRGIIPEPSTPPKAMLRIVVAIDPPGGGRAEAGIVVAGVDWDGRFWVLADHSGRMSPHEWASKGIDLFREFRADCVVAERNFGGAMVEATIQQAIETVRQVHPYFEVPVKLVTASRGKQQRAEPLVALYEQGRVFHVKGLEALEEQMVEWIPGEGDSPDRADACFVAGTMILTPSGEVPIESVRSGDLVETRSGPRRVVRAQMTSADAALWRLETATGLSLVGTANHPIAAADGSWAAMNMLAFHGGAVVRLGGVDSVMSSCALSMTAPVYNLEVEDVHEYVANGIVVHNCVWAIHELSESPALMPVAPGGGVQRSHWR